MPAPQPNTVADRPTSWFIWIAAKPTFTRSRKETK